MWWHFTELLRQKSNEIYHRYDRNVSWSVFKSEWVIFNYLLLLDKYIQAHSRGMVSDCQMRQSLWSWWGEENDLSITFIFTVYCTLAAAKQIQLGRTNSLMTDAWVWARITVLPFVQVFHSNMMHWIVSSHCGGGGGAVSCYHGNAADRLGGRREQRSVARCQNPPNWRH